jgi:hypothetical protein
MVVGIARERWRAVCAPAEEWRARCGAGLLRVAIVALRGLTRNADVWRRATILLVHRHLVPSPAEGHTLSYTVHRSNIRLYRLYRIKVKAGPWSPTA